MTDLPTTTIEVTTDGDSRSLAVYALGFDDALNPSETAARRAVEAALAGLQAVGNAQPFVPEKWLVLTTAIEGPVDTQPAGQVAWPLEPARAASSDEPAVCTRISGDEVNPVLDVFDGVDSFAVVDNGLAVSEIALRPVLTGEETCNLGELDAFVER